MPVISAPPYFVQLFFHDSQGNGWSEHWWWHADTYDAALADWNPGALGNLFDLRVKLFTPTVQCTYVRVSDATIKRDTVVLGVNTPQSQGTYVPTADTDMLPSDDALLLRLQGKITVEGNERPVFTLHPLRPIPEDCSDNGEYSPTPGFTTALDGFITALKTKGRIVVKSPDGVASTDIDSIEKMHMSQRKVGRPFGQSRGRSLRP